MPNIASLLKEEIARVSRKQQRAETDLLKRVLASQRAQISELKRRVDALESAVKRLGKASVRSTAAAATAPEQGKQIRYSAKSLASQRRRLGLSAAALARILGVSTLSVYKWESGQTRPRPRQIEAIAGLRSMGRREALQQLEALSGKAA